MVKGERADTSGGQEPGGRVCEAASHPDGWRTQCGSNKGGRTEGQGG